MTQRIGHAYGGDTANLPGDQSGGEVRVQAYYPYAHGWDLLLRAWDRTVANSMAAFCEAACANNNIGYSQARRNTLRDAARAAGWDAAKITSPCDCDCSSLMAVCAEAAGVDMSGAYSSGNAPWTGNMQETFSRTGAFVVLTEDKYLRGPEYLRRGDILVNVQNHTLMVLDDGALVAQPPDAIQVGDELLFVPGHGGLHFAPEDGDEPTFFRDLPDAAPARVVLTAPGTVRPYLILIADALVCGWVQPESLTRQKIHIVQAGETMWGIGTRYKVSMDTIRVANGMESIFATIHPGDKLIIPIDHT